MCESYQTRSGHETGYLRIHPNFMINVTHILNSQQNNKFMPQTSQIIQLIKRI